MNKMSGVIAQTKDKKWVIRTRKNINPSMRTGEWFISPAKNLASQKPFDDIQDAKKHLMEKHGYKDSDFVETK